MGLFDFFRKKPKQSDSVDASSASTPINAHITRPERSSTVPVESIQEGNHGDHWGGIFGFDTFYANDNLGNEMMAMVMSSGEETKLADGINKKEINSPDLIFSSLVDKKDLLTAYPIVNSTQSISFKTKVIKEWQHVNGIEAQVEGNGKDTFGLSFFATDFYEHMDYYKNNFNLEVILSGVAFSVTSANLEEGFSEEFVGYMPSKEYGKFSVMDYVGKVLELREVKKTAFDIEAYIAKVRLITMEDEEDFFTLDIFMNKGNIQLKELKVGDRISGMLWVQGRLVNH